MSEKIERLIYPASLYRHFKGELYHVDSISRHTETNELMVNYHALYEECDCHSRPYSMFVEEVSKDRVDNVTKQKYRFERLQGRIIYNKEKECYVYED